MPLKGAPDAAVGGPAAEPGAEATNAGAAAKPADAAPANAVDAPAADGDEAAAATAAAAAPAANGISDTEAGEVPPPAKKARRGGDPLSEAQPMEVETAGKEAGELTDAAAAAEPAANGVS